MSRQVWTEPAPYANGHSPKVMYIDSASQPSVSPSPGGVVPAGWIHQMQSHDGSLDIDFQVIQPVWNGGWPAYQYPDAAHGGSMPLPPNPARGAGL